MIYHEIQPTWLQIMSNLPKQVLGGELSAADAAPIWRGVSKENPSGNDVAGSWVAA